MRLNIKRLKTSPGQPSHFEQIEHWGHLVHKGHRLSYQSEVRMKGQAYHRSGVVYVNVQLATEIEAECSRCLKPMSQSVHLEETLEFQEEPQTGFQGVLLDGFSYEHGAEELELMPYFEKLISASLESKPLCRPGCRGLCPTCGQDLNEGLCRCVQKRSGDPRLEKLKELLQ